MAMMQFADDTPVFPTNEKFEAFLKRVSEKTIEERSWIAQQMSQLETKKDTKVPPDVCVLIRVIEVLSVLGQTELATKVSAIAEKLAKQSVIANPFINEIIDGAIKKNRSDAASGHRHHLHDEIVAIMKATWVKNPALSKTKMVAKLLVRYEDKVDEGTLKSWIKKEKLAPLTPKNYKNSALVIPHEFL